ncbi:MAG: agmatine deiminase family protein [bacterium]
MNRVISFFFFLFFGFTIFGQDLPNNLTTSEKVLLKNYNPPIFSKGYLTPPLKPVRTMAEWEELDGVLITWTSYTSILRQIVDYVQEECVVYIVCSDSNNVKSYLSSGGVPIFNLKFIYANFNSIWCRDFGPWSVYSDDIDSLYIVDWIYNRPRPADDLIPSVFAVNQALPLYQTTTQPYNLINTGGNFMTDGFGTGFASKLILNENPTKTESEINSILSQFMGINRFIKMETLPYDEIHHIDMHMKLLDEETLLVGQYPTGVADGPQIEANLQYIQNNFLSCYGRPYKIVRIPMPPQNGSYPNSGGDYRTYTNSLIVNKTVIIPTYELTYDTTAFRIYRQAMPGYNIVGINSNQIIPSLGTIHCITKEIGTKEPILIAHAPINENYLTSDGYIVKASIKTRSGINYANLFWTTDLNDSFLSTPMVNFAVDSFYAYIPQQQSGKKVYYYISANANSGKNINKPITAPLGFYSFDVNNALPVELTSFGYYISGSSITLNWQTATELNNKGFEIRSKKTETGEIEKVIGWINGNGTTSEINKYSFTQKITEYVKNEYLLYQFDYSGETKLIGKLFVDFTNNVSDYILAQNYPNPFNPSTTIKYSIPQKENVNLSVFNLVGQKVCTLVNEEKEAGSYSVEFNPGLYKNDFASGIYFYSISAGNFRDTKKIIYLK